MYPQVNRKTVLCAVYVFLILFANYNVCALEFLSNENARELQTTLAPVVIFMAPSTGTDAQKATHKYNATTINIAVGLSPDAAPTTDPKQIIVDSPTGYTFATDCKATTMIDATTGLTVDLTPDRTAKGIAVTSCAPKSGDTKKAEVTLTNDLPAVTSSTMHAIHLKLQMTATSTVTGWKVSAGDINDAAPDANWSKVTVQAVKGWQGIFAVSGGLGTPDNAVPSMRPTSLDGNQDVDVEVYHVITTKLEPNGTWRIKLPGEMSLTAGSCTNFSFKLCDTTKCDAKTVADISNNAIKDSKEIGCTYSTGSLLLQTASSIEADSGLYAKFKVRTNRLPANTSVSGGYVVTCPTSTSCAESTLTNYLSNVAYSDWGYIKNDVSIKAAASMYLLWFSFAILLLNWM